jgi:hypothetical protein
MKMNRIHSPDHGHKNQAARDANFVRDFILAQSDPRPPKDPQGFKDWILVNDFRFPVPLGSELESALATSLDDQGFCHVHVRCQAEPAGVELSMTAPGPLTIRAVMAKLRMLARSFGYSVPDGRVVAAVRDHRVTAAFSVEPAV